MILQEIILSSIVARSIGKPVKQNGVAKTQTTCNKPDPLSNILKPPLPLITPLLGPNLESLPETLDKKIMQKNDTDLTQCIHRKA